jgi:PIN domain nuclease of toxin-antitoxin system
MNLLFDTCTFIWFYSDPQKLSARATILLRDPTNILWLSTVTVWEIIVKNRIGKLPMTADIEVIVNDQVQKNGIRILPVGFRHVLEGRTLPLHHNDPFDRLLICQALADQLVVVTSDAKFRPYLVTVEW